MSSLSTDKRCLDCKLEGRTVITDEMFRLDFAWAGPAPKAGQFFMVKPKRSAVFLGRPISVAWRKTNALSFLIACRGRGTRELFDMHIGEEAELTGPLGNTWSGGAGGASVLKPLALIGGGIGLAPLAAFTAELPESSYDFYAGLKTAFCNAEERRSLLGLAASSARNVVIATEDGSEGLKGRIPDFFDAAKYAAVYVCGPEPMLKAVAARCKTSGAPCFASVERRMACGVGACLGCTVATVDGHRRCCADGPIFPAEELGFDE